MYRTDDEIRLVLQRLSIEPPVGGARRRQVMDILDDLAEELIGRGHDSARTLRGQIGMMRADLDPIRPAVELPDVQ